MKETDFNKLVTDGSGRREKILLKKGSDYDKIDSDRLSSFKKVATIANELEVAGCTTFKGSDIANILLILKQVRDANICSSGRPTQNESRIDTNDDWHNYIDLKLANEIDEEEHIPSQSIDSNELLEFMAKARVLGTQVVEGNIGVVRINDIIAFLERKQNETNVNKSSRPK